VDPVTPTPTPTPPPESLGDDDGLRFLARGSTLNMFGAGTSAALNLVLTVAIIRLYGQSRAGSFLAGSSVFLLLAQAAEAGGQDLVLRVIPQYRALGRDADARTSLRLVLGGVAALSTALALVTFAVAGPLGKTFGTPTEAAEMTVLLRVLAPFIPVFALYEVGLAATRGYLRMAPTVVIENVVRPAAQLAAVWGARVVLGVGPIVLGLAWGVPLVGVAVVAAVALARLASAGDRRRRSTDHEPTPTRELARSHLGFAAPRAVARIFQLSLQRLDIVLVASLATPADAAVYGALIRFLTVGILGVQAVQQVAQPKLAELLGLRDTRGARELFRTSTVWLLLVSWPPYLLFIVFAPLLTGVFGEARGGGTALVVLSAAQMFAVATGPVDIALLMAGRTGLSLVNQLFAVTIDIGLCLVLIPRHGVVGAAAAKCIALVAANLLPAIQTRVLLGLDALGRGLVLGMGAAALSFGAAAAVVRVTLGSSALSLGLAFVVASALYAAATWTGRAVLRLDLLVGSLRSGRPARAVRNGADAASAPHEQRRASDKSPRPDHTER
jgi:O-antigen/teichoic acid export membrane protein